MVTTRRPRKAAKSGKIKITDEAVRIFRLMRELPICSCVWGPRYFDHVECASCEQLSELQGQLHRELGLFVGDYPAINSRPDSAPDEIAGGRVYRCSTPHSFGPAFWDKGGRVFKQLMAAAGESA
jgi:hypothetical protein